MRYKHIFPKLFAEFYCIADKCPANCCRAGWSITWTSQEVKNLCSVSEAEQMSDIFMGDQYKTIKLSENGECPLLTAEGLCGIQKQFGEQYLSYTCRQYPRISRLCGEFMLSSCRPTCYAVIEKLFSDKDIMQLTEKESDSPMEVILTPEGQAEQRFEVFSKLRNILFGKTIDNAFEQIYSIYNIKKQDNIKQIFTEIFGWEIISASGNTDMIEDFVLRNLVLALFMEWTITGYRCEYTVNENISAFLFCADAVMLAANGAAELASTKEELLCSISDFIAAVNSDPDNMGKIIDKLIKAG